MAVSLRNRKNLSVPTVKAATKVLKIRDVETNTDFAECAECRQTEDILTGLQDEYLNTIRCIDSCHGFLERIYKKHTPDTNESRKSKESTETEAEREHQKQNLTDQTEKTEKLETEAITKDITSPDIKETSKKSNKPSSTHRHQGNEYLRAVIEDLRRACDQEMDVSSNNSESMDKKQKEPVKSAPFRRTTKTLAEEAQKKAAEEDKHVITAEEKKAKRAQRNHQVLERDDYRKFGRSYSAGQKGPTLYPRLRISHENPNRRPGRKPKAGQNEIWPA